MKDPTPKAIDQFIVRLVRGKLEDGQLSESPLSLRDIDAICEAFSDILKGVYHERIEYPNVPHYAAQGGSVSGTVAAEAAAEATGEAAAQSAEETGKAADAQNAKEAAPAQSAEEAGKSAPAQNAKEAGKAADADPQKETAGEDAEKSPAAPATDGEKAP